MSERTERIVDLDLEAADRRHDADDRQRGSAHIPQAAAIAGKQMPQLRIDEVAVRKRLRIGLVDRRSHMSSHNIDYRALRACRCTAGDPAPDPAVAPNHQRRSSRHESQRVGSRGTLCRPGTCLIRHARQFGARVTTAPPPARRGTAAAPRGRLRRAGDLRCQTVRAVRSATPDDSRRRVRRPFVKAATFRRKRV